MKSNTTRERTHIEGKERRNGQNVRNVYVKNINTYPKIINISLFQIYIYM
jgi:hypothetical protein